MNLKIMEGLIGASGNINMVNVPLRVYKEARQRGDTATMERAMEYAGKFTERAEEYKSKTDEGMKEEVEEIREREKLAQEKRNEEHMTSSMKESMEESVKESVKESRKIEEEKLDDTSEQDRAETDTGKEKNIMYTKTGEQSKLEQESTLPDLYI